MKVHKLAKYFPILEGDEFDLLVEDIKKHGQKEPIVLVGDKILDGVNRYRACKKLSIAPKTENYRGDDPLAYVISLNIRRRNLTDSQRAMLATEMLPEFEKEAFKRMQTGRAKGGATERSGDHPVRDGKDKHLARDDAARVFGVSGPSIQRAKRIKQEAPEKAKEIISGKTTVGAVDDELRQARNKELREQQKEATQKSLSAMREDEQRYLTDLLRAINLISEPPRELTQEGAKKIGETWRLIGLKIQKFLHYLEGSDERKEIGS